MDPAIAEYVQAELSAVGMGMRIDRLDAAGFDSRINRGEFDLDIELPNQNDASLVAVTAPGRSKPPGTEGEGLEPPSPCGRQFSRLVQ